MCKPGILYLEKRTFYYLVKDSVKLTNIKNSGNSDSKSTSFQFQ